MNIKSKISLYTDCYICGKSVHKAGLYKHIKDLHTYNDNKIYTKTKDGKPIYRLHKINCPVCQKLIRKKGLENHMKDLHGNNS